MRREDPSNMQSQKRLSRGISTPEFRYDLLSADGHIALVAADVIKNKVEGKKVQSVLSFVPFPKNRELCYYIAFGGGVKVCI
ncbi:hypothetical protein M378DRAFT_163782 [Amanita muscaria Koide BX008]|uniref:Uncharacterized protein n=1 Tax=Amanita muscaria (strain Koide BX008) TaxID=946122 RepID=A0A0C2X5S3_AMAMK|nr:hypothetical protein M378DRAFT_163782 [Amanita muscaria Koide BX008]